MKRKTRRWAITIFFSVVSAIVFWFFGHRILNGTDNGDDTGPGGIGRSLVVVRELNEVRVREAIDANLGYLLRVQREDGTLAYQLDPIHGKFYGETYPPHLAGYVLRHIQAAEMLRDSSLIDRAWPVFENLRRSYVVPPERPDIAIVEGEPRGLLGMNSLSAMTLALMPKGKLGPRERDWRDRFGKSILFYRLANQGTDSERSGDFYERFEQALAGRPPHRQPRYFPGVALLALVHLYESTGDRTWWEAAWSIAQGQAKDFERKGSGAVGLYCWSAEAWARMARLETDPGQRGQLRDWAYSHAEAVIEHQFRRPGTRGHPDYEGAADNANPPRTTPTSARAEALYECWLTARFFGDTDEERRYGDALLASVRFVMENQYTPDNSGHLRDPGLAFGGIRGGLIDPDIRLDYNQHALFAMLGALDVLRTRNGTETRAPDEPDHSR